VKQNSLSRSIAVAEAPYLELWQAPQVLSQLSRRDHEADGFREQPSSHEGQRPRRGSIEPLRVVDHTEQRPLLCGLGDQAQDREPDQEHVWRTTFGRLEHDPERVALGSREAIDAIEHWCAELVQAGVGKLHLRLDADRPKNPQARSRADQILEQRRLARSGLASHKEDTTVALPDRGDRAVQESALRVPTEQRRPSGSSRTSRHLRLDPNVVLIIARADRADRAPQWRPRPARCDVGGSAHTAGLSALRGTRRMRCRLTPWCRWREKRMGSRSPG
jgi:hypothetical protein